MSSLVDKYVDCVFSLTNFLKTLVFLLPSSICDEDRSFSKTPSFPARMSTNEVSARRQTTPEGTCPCHSHGMDRSVLLLSPTTCRRTPSTHPLHLSGVSSSFVTAHSALQEITIVVYTDLNQTYIIYLFILHGRG